MATASLLKEDHNYIETHGIHQIFVNAAVQLCAMRPENPFSFLRQYFQVLESMVNPYQCIFCNEILEFSTFEMHMQKCRSAPFRCNVCHQSFLDNTSLQNHRSIHAGAVASPSGGSSSSAALPPPPSSTASPYAHNNHLVPQPAGSGSSSHHSGHHQLSSPPAGLLLHPQAFVNYPELHPPPGAVPPPSHLSAATAHHLSIGVPGQPPFPTQTYTINNQTYTVSNIGPGAAHPPTANLAHLTYHIQQQQQQTHQTHQTQQQQHQQQQHHHHSAEEPYHQSHLSELMNFHTTIDNIKNEPGVGNSSEHNSQNESFTQQSDSSEAPATASASSTAPPQASNGSVPFQCTTCHRSFVHKHRYLRHMATHTDERPYVCKVCSKAFSQTYYLSRHEKTHTDEKPYRCDVCLKAFSQTYYLSRHLKTHSGERPFECTVCQKTFVLNYSLRKHMKTHANHHAS